MPTTRKSEDEEESEVEDLDSSREKRHSHKKKSRHRSKSKSRSRSRDKDKEKRRHKKHKKEKKKHKKRRSRSEDKEEGDGGDTPKAESNDPREETPEVEAQRLPGLGKYDSDGSEEGEIEAKEAKVEKEEKKEDVKEDARGEPRKDEDKRGREREDERKGRDREDGRARDRDEKRGRDLGGRSEGRERGDMGGRSEGRERGDMVGRSEGRERGEGGGRLEGKERGERSDKRMDGRERDRGERDRPRYNRDHEKGEGGREQYRREEGEVANEGGGNSGKREATVEGGSHVVSLSIEETNKLREKLGMKPLNTSAMPATAVQEDPDDENLPGTLIPGETVRHLPPEHWGHKAKTAKIKERIAQRKEKRSYDSKLGNVRGLGDDDSDDDAANWVKRQKEKTKQKEAAAKKEKMLMELDDEFGVGDIVTESLKEKSKKEYKARDLAGLRVEHAAEDITSGKDTVLILQDGDILDDEFENVLVNVNIVDNERTKKSLQNIKDGKAGYKAYDNEIVDDLTGDVTKKKLLYQYDEELDGIKKDSFKIDQKGNYNEEVNRANELAKIRHKLKLESVQSLDMPAPKMALDYYTEQEMATFKKPKKKRKVRKKILKADDLVKMANPESLLPTGFGSKVKKRVGRIIDDDEVLKDGRLPAGKGAAPMDLDDDVHYDDLPVVGDLTGVRVDDDDHKQVNSALSKIKAKLKQKKKHLSLDHVADSVIAQRALDDDDMDIDEDVEENQDMILDQTQEFCRGLGDIGNYEATGLGESVSSELLDFERSLQTERGRAAKEHSMVEEHYEKKEKRGTWAEIEGETVEEGSWKEGTKRKMGKGGGGGLGGGGGGREMRPAILEEETSAGGGLGAALKLARDKGYLDQEETKIKNQGLNNLKAQNYSIDDKAGQDDDKNSRRGGGGRQGGYQGGPTSSFSEKKGYKPEVLLEYVDDKGRAMSSKEAFRYLSHKFHGKGSGKLKTEKRHRKIMEDDLMQRMSSTDTPLGTLHRLQSKTKELATPYVVLSGNKQAMGGHTTLKK